MYAEVRPLNKECHVFTFTTVYPHTHTYICVQVHKLRIYRVFLFVCMCSTISTFENNIYKQCRYNIVTI